MSPLKGKRLSDGGYRPASELRRGDYWLTEDHRFLWVYLPHDAIEGVPALAHLPVNRGGATTEDGKDPAWDCTIEKDGTITVNPSIQDSTNEHGYHGWLQHGSWADG